MAGLGVMYGTGSPLTVCMRGGGATPVASDVDVSDLKINVPQVMVCKCLLDVETCISP